MTQDRNKGITGIAYNHLNLPTRIRFGYGADSIVFRYTAAGQKVAKLVYQTGKPTLRTDYLGPCQYEQDSLRFFPHAEGRVLRFANPTSGAVRYEREYAFKDHLGNLRLAYRLGQVRTYAATLEQDAATHRRESQQFDSLSVSPPVAQPTPLARTGAYAARLHAGGTAPQPLGPLTQLAVQKGDTLSVTAPGLYPQATSNNSFAFSLAGFVAALLQPAPAGTPLGADGSRRGVLPLLQVGLNAATLSALSQLPGGVPKGYLRVLVFNEDSALVDQRTVQLSAAALGNYETLQTGPLVLQQNGYVTVYVGNESAADVYFDDVRIEHRPGLQVQENQYDPFGLDLAGVSGAAVGLRLKNFYQFNGKENQLDLGLNWNHQDWRFFDYQLGRWHVVDPEAEEGEQESWTTYQFSFNNALRYSDPDGRQQGGPATAGLPENPWWAIGEVGRGVMQNFATALDRLSVWVNHTTTITNSETGKTVADIGVKVSSSTEVKNETKVGFTASNYLARHNSNSPQGPLMKKETKITVSRTEKVEASGKYRGATIKASAVAKVDLKGNVTSRSAGVSAGAKLGKNGAAVAATVSVDSKGAVETRVGVAADTELSPKIKTSTGFGVGIRSN